MDKERSTQDATEQSLSLKEMIQQVRDELVASERERKAKGQEALFQVDQVELVVNFVVTKTSKAKAGFSFQVLTFGGLDLGGDKGRQDQSVHTITLTLKAVDPGDQHRVGSDPSAFQIEVNPEGTVGVKPPEGFNPARPAVPEGLLPGNPPIAPPR